MPEAKRLKLALPNVDIDAYVQERWKDFSSHNTKKVFTLGDSGINEHIHPLIEKLALKRPEWKFTASYGSFHSYDNNELAVGFEIRDFKVFDKRELLGGIELGSYSWKTKLHSFHIGNHRTSQALSRANSYKTSNIDKAVKLVLKHFGAKDDKELYDEAYKVSVEKLSEQARHKGGMVRRMWNGNDKAAFTFMLAHWDKFVMTLTDANQRAALSKVPELYEEELLLDKLYVEGTTSGGGAFTVYQQGDYYLMSNDTGGLEKKTGEELPNNVRHKLGILKLVKDGQAVSDIGFRANENMFIVVRDKE
jgi:hypothetical protein